jgi:hypothetical protein
MQEIIGIMKIPDEIKVALVTMACIILLAVVFKAVLRVNADFLIINSPSYIFIAYIVTWGQTKESKCSSPLYWSLAVVAVTLAVILVYAI